MWDLKDAAPPLPSHPLQNKTNNVDFWADELCELVLLMALDPVQLVQAQPPGWWTSGQAEK